MLGLNKIQACIPDLGPTNQLLQQTTFCKYLIISNMYGKIICAKLSKIFESFIGTIRFDPFLALIQGYVCIKCSLCKPISYELFG